MCLQTVAEKFDSSTLIIDGWKEFGGTSSKPEFAAFSLGGKKGVPLDEWISADSESIFGKAKGVVATDGKTYVPGFHIYEDEDEARKLGASRRVYSRRMHTRGIQDKATVIIAQEMYVPSNPNGWPPKE